MRTWQAIAQIPPDTLSESRLQLHYAIQFVAATGVALADPLPDYSHASLTWNPDLEVFVGAVIPTAQPFQVAIDPVNLSLILLEQHLTTIASLPLSGRTMTEGLNWLKQELDRLSVDTSNIAFLDYPPDDFPDHPLAHGAVFADCGALPLQELANYYANTDQLLQTITHTNGNITDARIWSHHFDIARLMTLSGNKDGTPLTVGVGLSPGDTSYPQPYWYVSPYPYPDAHPLPELESGFWHTQHWVGAVLLASQLTKVSPEAQQQQVETFLNSAVTASIELLQPPSPAQV